MCGFIRICTIFLHPPFGSGNQGRMKITPIGDKNMRNFVNIAFAALASVAVSATMLNAIIV